MTETFEKLKALLHEKGTLTDDDINRISAEHGGLTPEENMWLQAELYERSRAAQSQVTLEQFLAANQVLDTAEPDSDEYRRAQAIVDAYLAGN
ncbi:MAG: hypothetical protein GXY36_05275 [Chloroflexi bacterium]|jgi:hypothetical protein|nr:hypothetical protein [Chloroflexota bacterium]